MSDIKFGTDGWRARIADEYTFANLARCAQGFANYLTARGLAGSKVIWATISGSWLTPLPPQPPRCWRAMVTTFT